MSDLAGLLWCCAGISPTGETTRLRPEARDLMNDAAERICDLEAALTEIRVQCEALGSVPYIHAIARDALNTKEDD